LVEDFCDTLKRRVEAHRDKHLNDLLYCNETIAINVEHVKHCVHFYDNIYITFNYETEYISTLTLLTLEVSQS